MSYRSTTLSTTYHRGYTIEMSMCGDTWEAWVTEPDKIPKPSFVRVGDSQQEAFEKAIRVIDEFILEYTKREDVERLAKKAKLDAQMSQQNEVKPLHDWLESKNE